MFAFVTIAAHPGFPEPVTVQLAGRGSCVVAGPSGSGKSTTAAAIDILLTGDNPHGHTVEGTTAKGTVVHVSPRARKVTTPTGASGTYTSAAEYRAALWTRPTSPEIIRGILHAHTWLDAAATPYRRGLRDLLLSVVPPGDLRVVVAEMMGDYALKDGDPLTLEDVGPKGARAPGALTLQKLANDAERVKAGELTAERAALARAESARDACAAPDDAALARAEKAVEQGAAWDAYDRAMVAWRTNEAARRAKADALATWEAADTAAGPRPTWDPAAAHATRTKLGEARATVRRLEAEEAQARRDAELAAAREEAAKQATAEAERRAALASVAPVAPSPSPFPSPQLVSAPQTPASLFSGASFRPTLTCPACAHTWSPS